MAELTRWNTIDTRATVAKGLNEGMGRRGRASIQLDSFQRELKLDCLFQADSICFRMEETSRGLLQHKHRAEQLKQEKTALTLSYEVRSPRESFVVKDVSEMKTEDDRRMKLERSVPIDDEFIFTTYDSQKYFDIIYRDLYNVYLYIVRNTLNV